MISSGRAWLVIVKVRPFAVAEYSFMGSPFFPPIIRPGGCGVCGAYKVAASIAARMAGKSAFLIPAGLRSASATYTGPGPLCFW